MLSRAILLPAPCSGSEPYNRGVSRTIERDHIRATLGADTIDNQGGMLIDLVPRILNDLFQQRIDRVAMHIGDFAAFRTDNVDVRCQIEIIVRMLIVGDIEWMHETELLQRVNSVVHRCLTDHWKGCANALEHLGNRWMPAVLDQRLANRVALWC